MTMTFLRSWPIIRPGWVAAFWITVAATVGLSAPNLTRLAAEGQAHLLGSDAESRRASEELHVLAWPDQGRTSRLAVAALHRPGGLTPADLDYAEASRPADRGEGSSGMSRYLRVLGPRLSTGNRRLRLHAAKTGHGGRLVSRPIIHLIRRPGDGQRR